jgi:hypothetical protein
MQSETSEFLCHCFHAPCEHGRPHWIDQANVLDNFNSQWRQFVFAPFAYSASLAERRVQL